MEARLAPKDAEGSDHRAAEAKSPTAAEREKTGGGASRTQNRCTLKWGASGGHNTLKPRHGGPSTMGGGWEGGQITHPSECCRGVASPGQTRRRTATHCATGKHAAAVLTLLGCGELDRARARVETASGRRGSRRKRRVCAGPALGLFGPRLTVWSLSTIPAGDVWPGGRANIAHTLAKEGATGAQKTSLTPSC